RGRPLCWCPRPGSNRHDREVEGFSYHFGFRRQRNRCSWSGARLHHSLAAVGARRLLSTPSRNSFELGLGSALARMLRASRAFADFDGRHLRGFPRRAQIASSPLRLPISPLGHDMDVKPSLQIYTGPYLAPSNLKGSTHNTWPEHKLLSPLHLCITAENRNDLTKQILSLMRLPISPHPPHTKDTNIATYCFYVVFRFDLSMPRPLRPSTFPPGRVKGLNTNGWPRGIQIKPANLGVATPHPHAVGKSMSNSAAN